MTSATSFEMQPSIPAAVSATQVMEAPAQPQMASPLAAAAPPAGPMSSPPPGLATSASLAHLLGSSASGASATPQVAPLGVNMAAAPPQPLAPPASGATIVEVPTHAVHHPVPSSDLRLVVCAETQTDPWSEVPASPVSAKAATIQLASAVANGVADAAKFVLPNVVVDTVVAQTAAAVGVSVSIAKSTIRIFKSYVGPGMFFLPAAYQKGGYIMSPLLAILLAFTVIEAGTLLIRVKRRVMKTGPMLYPDIAGAVFGPIGAKWSALALFAMQCGFCLVFVQTAATLLSQLMPFDSSFDVFVVITTVLLVPGSLMAAYVQFNVRMAMLATYLVIFCIIASTYYSAKRLSDNGVASTVVMWQGIDHFPLFMSTHIAVFEGIAVLLAVDNTVAAEDKHKVSWTYRSTMSGICVMYIMYSSLGYLAFGTGLTGSIMSSLPDTVVANYAMMAMALMVLLSQNLQSVPAVDLLDRFFAVDKSRGAAKSPGAIATRILFNGALACVIVIIGPKTVGIVLSLTGSIAGVSVCVVLPAILNLNIGRIMRAKRDPAYAQRPWCKDDILDFFCKDADDLDIEQPLEAQRAAVATSLASPVPLERQIDWRKVRCIIYCLLGTTITIVGTYAGVLAAIEFVRSHVSIHY